jgi:hypothetical protein
VTVHIDRAHHHPRVYKRLGFWQAKCPRCGLLRLGSGGAGPFFIFWEMAYGAGFHHATEVHS